MNMTMIPLSTTSHELSGLRGDSRLEGVLGAARELVAFAESEPMLASRAGVEVLALEAKVLMQKVNLSGSRCGLGRADFALLERLDGIVSISNNRMDECIASMDGQMSGRTVESLSGIIGLAGGAIGIIRSIF